MEAGSSGVVESREWGYGGMGAGRSGGRED